MFWILGIVAVFLKHRFRRGRLASAQESPSSRRRLQSLAKSMFRKYKSLQQQDSPIPYSPSVLGPSTSSSSSSPSPSSHGGKTSPSNGDSSPHSPPPSSSVMDGVNDLSAVLRKHKNMDLQKLLLDENEYSRFLHSLDPVRQLDAIRADLKRNNADLARENLEKAAQVAQLQNQCTVIRTAELAAAQERFVSAQKTERQLSSQSSAAYHLERLDGTSSICLNLLELPDHCLPYAEATKQVDDESEDLNRRFLAGEIDLTQFCQNYRKQRNLYHRRTLLKLAAGDSGIIQ